MKDNKEHFSTDIMNAMYGVFDRMDIISEDDWWEPDQIRHRIHRNSIHINRERKNLQIHVHIAQNDLPYALSTHRSLWCNQSHTILFLLVKMGCKQVAPVRNDCNAQMIFYISCFRVLAWIESILWDKQSALYNNNQLMSCRYISYQQ